MNARADSQQLRRVREKLATIAEVARLDPATLEDARSLLSVIETEATGGIAIVNHQARGLSLAGIPSYEQRDDEWEA